MQSRRVTSYLCLALADAAVLIGLRPDWAALRAGLSAPHAWVAAAGGDSAAGSVAGAVLWLVALWFGLGLAAGLVAALPGAAGQCRRGIAHDELKGAIHP